MAIDRRTIAERLYGFAGEPTCGLVVGPTDYASTANDDCLSFDLEGAVKLLDDNGVVDTDGDGIREYNGVPLTLTFTTSTNPVRQETQSLIRDWWGGIGIGVDAVHYDASIFFGGDPVADKGMVYRRFYSDIQMYATGPDIDPQQYLSDQLCDAIPTPGNHWAGGNIARACNEKYDELYTQLAETEVGVARAELIKRLNDILVQNYYEIPLVNRGVVSAHHNSLKGVQINAWDSELWNLAEWHRQQSD